VIAATQDYIQSAPSGLAYWEAVNELIQREPVEDRDRFFYAMLRDLGIEKGKPFTPDDRQKRLFEDAALLGEEISKALTYEKRFIPNIRFDPTRVGNLDWWLIPISGRTITTSWTLAPSGSTKRLPRPTP
jgi:hypothetical protein